MSVSTVLGQCLLHVKQPTKWVRVCISITDSFQMDAFREPITSFSFIDGYFCPAKYMHVVSLKILLTFQRLLTWEGPGILRETLQNITGFYLSLFFNTYCNVFYQLTL